MMKSSPDKKQDGEPEELRILIKLLEEPLALLP